MDNISASLRRLDLSASEQSVYLSLLRQGRATPRVLADRTGLTRPSVYDQLRKLLTINLVVELAVAGKAVFAASELKHLDALLIDKIDRLEQSRQFLADALPAMQAGLDTVVPKIRFFEGEEGMKQLMKDVMWHDHTTLIAVWNDEMMKKIFDSAFLRWWNERRIVRNIAIQWQVPVSDSHRLNKVKTKTVVTTPMFYHEKTDTIIEYRSDTAPTMSRLIYDQTVAHISSPQEAFGFIVESSEFAKLQRL